MNKPSHLAVLDGGTPLLLINYSPDQPRDQGGRFSHTSGAGIIARKVISKGKDITRKAVTSPAGLARKAMVGKPGKPIHVGRRISEYDDPDWVLKWERDNTPKELDKKARGFANRLVEQKRELASVPATKLMRALQYTPLGFLKLGDRRAFGNVHHASWVDKRTGYRYDFHPAKMSRDAIFGEVDGVVVETAPNGEKRQVKGPKYSMFKRNCQTAGAFLPRYIKKFQRMRRLDLKRQGVT